MSKKPLTNFDVRYNMKVRIKGLEVDIETFKRSNNPRNQVYIDDLTKVLKDYESLLANIPENDDPYLRPAQK